MYFQSENSTKGRLRFDGRMVEKKVNKNRLSQAGWKQN